MRTLYVTDLDGTLLRPTGTLAEEDRQVLGMLVHQRGILLTYATARSYRVASRVVGNDLWRIPVVVHNGAFTVDTGSGRPVRTHLLDADTVRDVVFSCERHQLAPLLFGLHGGRERAQWVRGAETPALRHFIADRPGDPRFAPVADFSALDLIGVFGIAVMATPDPIAALDTDLDRSTAPARRTISRDTYHPEDTWLEITAPQASKAGEVLALRAALRADRIVCFGDNHNDLSLFDIADEAYAVGNASDAVRASATALIGRNTDSGVVRWLWNNARGAR